MFDPFKDPAPTGEDVAAQEKPKTILAEPGSAQKPLRFPSLEAFRGWLKEHQPPTPTFAEIEESEAICNQDEFVAGDYCRSAVGQGSGCNVVSIVAGNYGLIGIHKWCCACRTAVAEALQGRIPSEESPRPEPEEPATLPFLPSQNQDQKEGNGAASS